MDTAFAERLEIVSAMADQNFEFPSAQYFQAGSSCQGFLESKNLGHVEGCLRRPDKHLGDLGSAPAPTLDGGKMLLNIKTESVLELLHEA